MWSNWAETYTVTPKQVHYPKTISEVQAIVVKVKQAGDKLTVVGMGHSPSDIAVAHDHQMSLSRMNRILSVDTQRRTCTFQGGVILHDLISKLAEFDLMLETLGSISEQTFVGAVQTGTHGTGLAYPFLGEAIIEVVLIDGTGKLQRLKNDPELRAVKCGLGCFGIIVEVTIKCVPKTNFLEQVTRLSFDEVINQVETLASDDEYLRIHWYPHTENCIIWRARRTDLTLETSGSKLEEWYLVHTFFHKLISYHLLQLFYYLGLFFPNLVIPLVNYVYFYYHWWYSNLVSKARPTGDQISKFNFDCLFKQHVTEWALPLDKCDKALIALKSLIESAPFYVHFPVEVRFVGADGTYLSPSSGRETAYLGIIFYKPYNAKVDWIYRPYFDKFEEEMLKLSGRPHWAKSHKLTKRELIKLYGYDNWSLWNFMRKIMDPNEIFVNDYIRRIIS